MVLLDRSLLRDLQSKKACSVVHSEHVNGVCSEAVHNAIVAPDDFANVITIELWDDSTGCGKLMKSLNGANDSFGDESCVAG